MARGVIYLKEGGVYFLASFTDPSFSVPVIKTIIYEGIDSEHGHMFEEVTGENKGYICFPDKISPSVLDQKALVEWLSEEHSQKTTLKTYEYKSI